MSFQPKVQPNYRPNATGGKEAVVRFGWFEEGVISPASEAAFAVDELDDIVMEVGRQCKLAAYLTSFEFTLERR